MNIEEMRGRRWGIIGGNVVAGKFIPEESTPREPPPVLFAASPSVNDPDDSVVLYITNGRGKEVLWVTADGGMHFAPGFTADEHARCFMQAINMATQRAIFPLG